MHYVIVVVHSAQRSRSEVVPRSCRYLSLSRSHLIVSVLISPDLLVDPPNIDFHTFLRLKQRSLILKLPQELVFSFQLLYIPLGRIDYLHILTHILENSSTGTENRFILHVTGSTDPLSDRLRLWYRESDLLCLECSLVRIAIRVFSSKLPAGHGPIVRNNWLRLLSLTLSIILPRLWILLLLLHLNLGRCSLACRALLLRRPGRYLSLHS